MNLIQKIVSMFNPMLSCEQVNQFIIDYLDDNLPASTRKKFESHLHKCPNCSSFFDQYNDTVTLVNEEGQLEIPEDLAQFTRTFLQEHIPQQPS